MCVLFTSVRPLTRAENLKAVYDAYDGEKEYIQRTWGTDIPSLHSGRYKLMVTDELLNDSPGKSIFIGHGCGAGKLYGLQQRGTWYRPGAIDYAIASSKDMIPFVAQWCGLPESKVIPLGMPRTDAYFSAKKPEHDGKRHLYAPTFRNGRWMPDLNKVWRMLPDGHRFIVKPHMVTGNKIASIWPNVEIADAWEPSTPYLVDAETVITDYSSIMFDAMVLRKPVILFAKDKDRYLRERGMYLPYPEQYSMRYCETEEMMVKFAVNSEWNNIDEMHRDFFVGACDGKSTARTIDLIKECL